MEKLTDLNFETGPIRPPSEAYSLLIRATRNCPWNRCQFCPVYKGQKFEFRPVQEILNDIEIAGTIASIILDEGSKIGYGISQRQAAAYIYNRDSASNCMRQVALWIYGGGESAFLQDANSIIMHTPELVMVLTGLKNKFPDLNRITAYCRSHTAARKTPEEFKEMRDAGLSRIHIGMESGSNEVLVQVEKGATAADHVKGGRQIIEAGIELSEYYMPGLGGRKLSKNHAMESAKVLSEIDPDYIRLRALHVGDMMPLWERVTSGDFELLCDDDMVKEIGEFLDRLDFNGELKSDHILNLLPEIEGRFPEAKSKCIAVVDRYLAMSLKERLNFRFGRRIGLYHSLDDLYDATKYGKVDRIMNMIDTSTGKQMEEFIEEMKRNFI